MRRESRFNAPQTRVNEPSSYVAGYFSLITMMNMGRGYSMIRFFPSVLHQFIKFRKFMNIWICGSRFFFLFFYKLVFAVFRRSIPAYVTVLSKFRPCFFRRNDPLYVLLRISCIFFPSYSRWPRFEKNGRDEDASRPNLYFRNTSLRVIYLETSRFPSSRVSRVSEFRPIHHRRPVFTWTTFQPVTILAFSRATSST